MSMYMILVKFADNDTGITHIGYEKLENYLSFKSDMISSCLNILSNLGLIHYKSGYGFGDAKCSNAYIFPYEQWLLPANKDEYDNYILHPERYKAGKKEGYTCKKGHKEDKVTASTGKIVISAPIEQKKYTPEED